MSIIVSRGTFYDFMNFNELLGGDYIFQIINHFANIQTVFIRNSLYCIKQGIAADALPREFVIPFKYDFSLTIFADNIKNRHLRRDFSLSFMIFHLSSYCRQRRQSDIIYQPARQLPDFINGSNMIYPIYCLFS